jgi:hypothetical protein
LPPTLLHQQHAAQASKLLKAHTPVKAPSAIPQTAPRPVASQKRTCISTDIPTMPSLMTPQAKAKVSGAKQTSVPRSSLAMPAPSFSCPDIESIATAAVSVPSNPSNAESNPQTIEKVEDATCTPTTAPSANLAPQKSAMSDKQLQTVLKSVIWNGLVDALAIKLLEGSILRKSISIVKQFCPRDGDDANDVMDKYVAGKKMFDQVQKSQNTMISLIGKQKSQGMTAPAKPFKTCFYYLYRALFEEYHEQIPDSTTFFENAIISGAEPRHHVHNAFKHFCGRIRELTQQQMGVRQSLAIGVRRMQAESGMPSETAQDAQALVDLLEEDEFDIPEEEEMDVFDDEEEEMAVDEVQEEIVEMPTSEEFEEIIPNGEFVDGGMDVDMEEEFVQEVIEGHEEGEVVEAPESTLEDDLSQMEYGVIEVPARRQVCTFQTPSKLEHLARTPLGKPKRQIMFGNDVEEEVQSDVSSFTLVYEASKPSRKTKQIVESQTVVTPMRRSNRIAQPLRMGQSTDSSDLLPDANWAYQPNEELIASGRIQEAMERPKATPKKHSHLVPLASASEKLAQINSNHAMTPSRLGPPKRVPVSFNDEDDEDDVSADQLGNQSSNPESSASDISSIVAELQSMDIPTTSGKKTIQQAKEKMEENETSFTPMEESSSAMKEEAVPEKVEDMHMEKMEETIEEDYDSLQPVTPARKSTRKAVNSNSTTKSSIATKRGATSAKKTSRAVTKYSKIASHEDVDDETHIDEQQEEQQDMTNAKQTGAVVGGDEPASLYQSIRKAAYSAAYGSGYVVTPAKKQEAQVDGDDIDSTPARRSRRLASKKH